MKNFLVSSAIASIAFAVPALAGGKNDPIPDPVVETPPIYVAPSYDWTGAYAGVQLGYGQVDVSGGTADDREGLLGGVHAGYDFDFGNFVVGGLGEYNIADTEIDGASIARLRVRGGPKVGTSGLIYGTAGASFGTAEIGGTDYSDTGYVIGVGYEQMVSDKISVGGEVLYDGFEDFDGTGVDISGTSVQAKLSYRF